MGQKSEGGVVESREIDHWLEVGGKVDIKLTTRPEAVPMVDDDGGAVFLSFLFFLCMNTLTQSNDFFSFCFGINQCL